MLVGLWISIFWIQNWLDFFYWSVTAIKGNQKHIMINKNQPVYNQLKNFSLICLPVSVEKKIKTISRAIIIFRFNYPTCFVTKTWNTQSNRH